MLLPAPSPLLLLLPFSNLQVSETWSILETMNCSPEEAELPMPLEPEEAWLLVPEELPSSHPSRVFHEW
jgi:hypothetical protein